MQKQIPSKSIILRSQARPKGEKGTQRFPKGCFWGVWGRVKIEPFSTSSLSGGQRGSQVPPDLKIMKTCAIIGQQHTFSAKKRRTFRLVFFNIFGENIGGRVQKKVSIPPCFSNILCENFGGRVPKNRRDTENDRSRIRLELNLMDDYDVHEVEFKADSTATFFRHKSSICI